MTNPFADFLGQWSSDNDLKDFVSAWNDLEWIVVRVYRDKITPEKAAADFDQIWPWLREVYPTWQRVLEPYWKATKAGGEPTQADPFALLLTFQTPAEIQGDWRAMQHLPAAREAINRLLQAQDAAN